MVAKKLQAASIILSGSLILMALSGIPPFQSKVVGISALVLGYLAALIAVGITWFRYRIEDRAFLPNWRRIPYALSLVLMVALSLSPLLTWLLVLSGKYPTFPGPASRHEPLFFILFGTNVSAMVLLWFGRGWSRLGLTALNFVLLLLWAFPIGIAA